MTCGACKLAERNPMTGHRLSGCLECEARTLAKSDGFRASMAHGRFRDDYTAALKAIVGDDGAALDKLHQAVRRWDVRIRGAA